MNIKHYRATYGLFLFILIFLAACQSPEEATPVAVVPTETLVVVASNPTSEEIPATWTAVPQIDLESADDAPTQPPPATNTAVPTQTPLPPTHTPVPTDTPTATPTDEPTNTPLPAPTAAPVTAVPPTPASDGSNLGNNLLPNPSFEEGHYLQSGIAELQLPNSWRIEWDEGPTGVGNESWDVYVRPEARVLSTAFLPPHEHPLYIYEGLHTVKIFKGFGAVSFRLLTDVTLEPGSYIIEAQMFPDTVMAYVDGQKVWASDPISAEMRFLVGNGGTVFTPQAFGRKNVHNYTFTVTETQTMTVGVGLRGRFAISNNGWFMDNFSLRRVQ